MDAPEKEYRLGPLALVSYPSNEPVEQTRAWHTRQMSEVEKAVIAASYLVLIAIAALWLLYVVLPFYLSSYDEKTLSQIEWSNDWLWEYKAYALDTPAWSQIVGLAAVARMCVVAPLFFGAVLDLVYSWRRSSWRMNALKVVCLVFLAAVNLAPWDSADGDKLLALLWD